MSVPKWHLDQFSHFYHFYLCPLPSVLWCCWLGGRKGIRPVKTVWWGAGMVICLDRDADLHVAHLMPLPLTASCFSKIQIGFAFLVPAYPGSPGKRAVKQVCVCVFFFFLQLCLPSVLWHCWVGVKKSIQPVKIEWWGVGVVISLEQGADCLHMVQLMPLPSPNPTISCPI